MSDARITLVSGRAVPVRGDDIDTDRIMPARYLRCVTFDGLEDHVFEDDRAQLRERQQTHAFDEAPFQGASVLFANRNFGCGSSREHAPQGLARWGIRTVVAESFAEIFFGNCVALGVPCLVVSRQDINALMDRVEADPSLEVAVDLEAREVRVGDLTVKTEMPEGARDAFVRGTWDATGLLRDRPEEIQAIADSLPYVGDFGD
jgi:3-isopropylmalate/(R)-2-methylmalate dehydratase small subunit